MTEVVWVLDRIEDGTTAVLVSEAGDERRVPASELPEAVTEGQALQRTPEGYQVDDDATERLRKEAERLRSSARRGPSGPLSL